MAYFSLRRFGHRLLSSLRRLLRIRRTVEEDYRDFNGNYFSSFYEQERMLADPPRMEFYRAAIERHIRPGDRVIDLGTGTGILAALASRQGAACVYAIDHSAILDTARVLADANKLERVEFIAAHSTEFSVAGRVDVILHEQMGDCLFDEGMVANVCDLRNRLLKPGGRILPSQFEFFCEPVKVRDDRHVPFIWELKVCGYDYSALERDRPQNSDYYQCRSSDPTFVEHFLGTPAPALTFDLQSVDEATLPKSLVITRTVLHAGRLDGFVIFFRTRVDADLVLSSGPIDPGRAPHWGYRILRTEYDTFDVGDELEVRLTVDRWSNLDSWRWSHRKLTPPVAPATEPPTPTPVGDRATTTGR